MAQTEKDPGLLFREVQPFYQQRITWIVLILFGAMVFWMAMQDMLLDMVTYIVYVVLAALLALTLFGKLVTEVRRRELHVRMIPFHRKAQVFTREHIVRWAIVRYAPLKDYGGWGIRFGRKGKAYTVHGRTGLKLRLRNNQDLLVGTQHPDELSHALKQAGL